MATTIRQSWRGMGQKLSITREDFEVYRPAFEHEDADIAQNS
ncbi:MAG: hypothetical protein ACTHLA_00710 [Asticcacaulis sp.]